MRKLLIITALFLSGCAANPGVVQTGNNEYMVHKTAYGDTWSNGNQILAGLYLEAAEKCGGPSRVERVEENSLPGMVFVRNANATLRFRCVDKP